MNRRNIMKQETDFDTGFYRVREAAAALNITKKQVYQLVASGQLKFKDISHDESSRRMIRIYGEEINRYRYEPSLLA